MASEQVRDSVNCRICLAFKGKLVLILALHPSLVLNQLYQNKKIAAATHNMYAYRILKEDSKTWLQDCDDDGETHAGSRLLHLLQILNCRNVLVVVSRWYGGIQLHADRFKHINNVARQTLSEFGFISTVEAKKVDDSSKIKKGVSKR
ncbi:Protein IMPACT [Orchesella cincta]|uniref:Protein IMPACT n=1 Tax=Orchesella cincta TaxID=48709 RepID=A0A1D2M123_ORCCI|nr:Protein IMPACT [Orchesella cincta]